MLYILPAGAEGANGINDLDLTLIRLLQANGRASFVHLARKTGQPERLVARRVEQLIADGVIQIAPVCNPAKLGFRSMAIVMIRLVGGRSAETFVREMLEHRFIDYIATTLGAHDVLLEAIASDDMALRRLIEQHVSGHADVAAVEVHPYTGLSYQQPVWDDVQKGFEPHVELFDAGAEVLDDTDRRLVACLSRNGRATFNHLAEEMGVSESYVRKRYNALLARGDMQVHALTNPVSLGYRTHCWLRLKIEPGYSLSDRTRAIAALEHIAYVAACTGSADLLVEVICQSKAELRHLIGERLSRIDGVRCTDSHLCTELYYRSVQYTHPDDTGDAGQMVHQMTAGIGGPE